MEIENNLINQGNGQNRPQLGNNNNPNGNMRFPNNGNGNNMIEQGNMNNSTNGTFLNLNQLSMKKGNSDNDTLTESSSNGYFIRNSFILIMLFMSLL